MKIHIKTDKCTSMDQRVFVECALGELVALACSLGRCTNNDIEESIKTFVRPEYVEQMRKYNEYDAVDYFDELVNELKDIGAYKRSV